HISTLSLHDALPICHDYSASYEAAARIGEERRLYVIEPFLPELVLGVATYAFELLTAIPDVDTVYVPIGMGSGICGLIRARDLLGLKTKIVGTVSAHAPAHALSFSAGHVVTTESAKTIADGVAVRVPKPEAVDNIKRPHPPPRRAIIAPAVTAGDTP